MNQTVIHTQPPSIEDSTAAPWDNIVTEDYHVKVFADRYPVTEGHLLFVPTKIEGNNLWECYKAAYKFGFDGVVSENWDAFNIGQNVGESAGQTVMYPHVHMIPRRKGDMEDPRGGVRHVIPEKGNYHK
jgi:diadenosine tetraphosphate (Ap4A) HIT family hydrolase